MIAVHLLTWFLLTFGITFIVTFSTIAAPIRRAFSFGRPGHVEKDEKDEWGQLTRWQDYPREMISCPLCMGFHVSLWLTFLKLGPAVLLQFPWYVAAPVNGFCGSVWCFFAFLVLKKLGALDVSPRCQPLHRRQLHCLVVADC